jgi:hypothetical protein
MESNMQQPIQTLEVKSNERVNEHVSKIGLDEFFEKYKPVSNPESTDGEDFWLKDCMFDISDKKYVHEISQTTPGKVWTVHHSDSGDIEWIESGFHYVDRNGFIITEVPYTGAKDLLVHEDYRTLDAKIIVNLKEEVDHNDFSKPLADMLYENNFAMGFALEVEFDFESIKNFLVIKLTIIEFDADPEVNVVLATLRKVMDEYKSSRPEIASFALDVAHEVKSYF